MLLIDERDFGVVRIFGIGNVVIWLLMFGVVLI